MLAISEARKEPMFEVWSPKSEAYNKDPYTERPLTLEALFYLGWHYL
jgi:hypothetical protein